MYKHNSNKQFVALFLPDKPVRKGTKGMSRKWLEINTKFSAEWPNITSQKEPPADADEHKGEEGKFEKFFTPEPGEGD